MAPAASELATLRALTYRISSTPTAQLPHHVPAIAASLAHCRTLLSSPQPAASKTSSESSVAVHKYRTLLSALLQHRALHGRWSATVLIKATVELGGWETLQKCLPWVRGLLAILSKPDPPCSKKLCIITLTRIFILTREYPTLIRDITTPSLPPFIQSCLHMAHSKAPATLVQVILETFNQLLPRHPTIFRPYLKQLHPLLARMLAPTPSNALEQEQSAPAKMALTDGLVHAAQQLYVQTSTCAPKGAASEEWEKHLKTAIGQTHRVADRVFRAVFEDWQPSSQEPSANGHTLDDQVQDLESNDMALPPWSGLFAGSERLTQLVRLLHHFLANPTPQTIAVNISALMDLITRMLSITIPSSAGKADQNTVKLNNQISKEERENLWLVLPGMHAATIELLLVLAERSVSSTLPLDALIVDQIVWVFASEKDFIQVRTACYHVIATLLKRSGVALSKSSVDSLVPLMRACCDDLLPSESASTSAKAIPSQTKTNGVTSSQTTANADTFLNSTKGAIDITSGFEGLEESAWLLLPVLLGHVRAQYLSDALRSRLDRTAILTQHKDAMIASVLNPPPSKKFGKPAASILPLMARSFPDSPDVEGLLRPRMPAIRLGNQDTGTEDDAEEEEESEDAEDEIVESEAEQEDMATDPGDDKFMGHELDTILESAGRTEPAMKDFSTPDPAEPEAPAPAILEQPLTRRETRSSTESAKRAQLELAPSSPSKRRKTGEVKDLVTTTPIASTTLKQGTLSSLPLNTVSQTPSFTVSSTSSAVPEFPQPGEVTADGDDSDEDDAVSLVFGQDTDDDSQ
ncbi:rRNA processing/ribosome biogenesis-domain-containing protein [Ampelomyces quisqualis]|uniref:Pre-rRNA-processing protein RIX1 n=1 Tax=Ampelomyces quisqualis TaxID=50730 RepID=A0A6A5QIW2_AMPQU|nr:rRNA processing/ribosome biogenesis-domain-containing protein [Ampelomyces quisqualis]